MLNVQNKYDPGRRTMTKTTLNRALRPYPGPAERGLMNTDAKKAGRAKRKLGIKESSPAWAKRLANSRSDYKGVKKDINVASKHDRKSAKLSNRATASSLNGKMDQRKLKAMVNHRNKTRPGLQHMIKPTGSSLSRSARITRKK